MCSPNHPVLSASLDCVVHHMNWTDTQPIPTSIPTDGTHYCSLSLVFNKSEPSALSDHTFTERYIHNGAKTFTGDRTELYFEEHVHWLSSSNRGDLSRSDSSYLHCLTFSEQISEREALLAMTGCDSVSHLLSYIAAFASHCKLQKAVAAGWSPEDSFRQRGHASFAGSHQRQPGSAPDQHTDPVLFVRGNKIVKKKIVLNDATRLAWGLWASDNLQLMKHGWDCSELRGH